MASHYSYSQLRQLARNAGWNDAQSLIAAAIALAESSGDPGATGPYGERGLWQVYPRAHPDLAARYNLYDPQQNADAAYQVYQSQGWGAWTTYLNGAYKQFLQGAGSVAESWWQYKPTGNPDRSQGRNDLSIGMPLGTPITSPVAGVVVGPNTLPGVFGQTGLHTSGGNVDVEADVYSLLPKTGDRVVAFGHLERLNVKPGDTINAGDIIGWSGGDPAVDPHSSGPHLAFFSYLPNSWDSVWTVRPNPQDLYAAIQGNGGVYPGEKAFGGIGRGPSGPAQDDPCGQYNQIDPRYYLCQIQQSLQQTAWYAWLTQPVRIVKLVVGAALLGLAAFLFIAPTVTQGAALAAAPETGGLSLAASQRLGRYNRQTKRRTPAKTEEAARKGAI